MESLNRSISPAPGLRQPLLAVDPELYTRQLIFTAWEMATTNNPRVRLLCAQVLALQAPQLEALASGGNL